MKILKLTIHNIASIEDALIDFTVPPLSNAGLFLISGKTGAGKSTILDCICLTLYDETPRLSSTLIRDDVKDNNSEETISANDTRQMLRKYTAEGFAELEFIGNNNIKYRATWSVQRAHRKVSGKLQSSKRTLERLDNHQVLTKKGEISREIEAAINLDFKQFCRTVMLAQGEFTKFLNSNDNDKSAILSKITGTEIYTELGKRIYDKCREESLILDKCRVAAENLEILSEEEINSKTEELNMLIASADKITESLDQHNKLLSSLHNIEQYKSEIANIEKSIQSSVADYFLYQKEIHDLETNSDKLLISIDNTQKQLDSFNGITNILTDSSNIISTIDRLAALKKSLSDDSREIANSEKQKITHLIPECDKTKKEVDGILCQINTLESDIKITVSELEKVDLACRRKEKEDVMQSAVACENLNINLDAYISMQNEQKEIAKELEVNESEVKATEKYIGDQKEPIMKAEMRVEVLQNAYDKLFASSEKLLSKIRNVLAVGDTCPLCHSRITSQLPTESDISSLIEDSKKDLDTARAQLESLNKDLSDKKATLKIKTKEILRLSVRIADTSKLDEAERKIRDLASDIHLNIESLDPIILKEICAAKNVEIDNSIKRINSQISDGEKLERNLKDQNSRLGELRLMHEHAIKVHNEAVIKLTSCETNLQSLDIRVKQTTTNIAELQNDLEKIVKNTKYYDSLQETAVLRNSILSDKRDYEALSATINKLISSREISLMNLDFHHAAFESLKDILPVEFITSAESQSLPPSPTDLNSFSRKLIGTVKANMELYGTTCKKLSEENNTIGNCKVLFPESNLTIEEISRLYTDEKNKLDAVNQQVGAIRLLLNRDIENREKKSQLIEDYCQQEQVIAKWKKLCDLFGDAEGKKFRKIAQSYILSELIHSADYYLSGFTDRYNLAIEPGTFVIMVEDAWDGYTRRPASTISGGESFMVSLSLALALSDLNTDFSVDTLFIDEGFGSLSSEYLQSAINTLQTLHTRSGRRIGIISHVEELRERIPVQICVQSTPNSSASTISIVS